MTVPPQTDPLAADHLETLIARRGAQALEELAAMRASDPPTTGGRVLSYVYDSGIAGLDELAIRAAALAHGVNGLDPTVFGSVAQIHGGIVRRVREILGGDAGDKTGDNDNANHKNKNKNDDDEVFGLVTSGGTESCMLACLAAREVAGRAPGSGGTIVAPVTAHAAFRKAAHVLGMRFVGVEVDPATGRVAAEDLLDAVDADTCLVVVSAPSYPTGVIDPVAQVAAGLEARHDSRIGLHVDACLGGLVLPFWPGPVGGQPTGDPTADRADVEPAPAWDLRIARVTSISADLHKYGFAPKGTSVLLSRGRARHRASWFATVDWPGYPVVNPTLAGSKPLEPAAAAWAVLAALGDDGQRELVARTARATARLTEGLSAIEGLRVIDSDPGPLIAVVSDEAAPSGRRIHPHLWADACGRRGISVQAQPAYRQERGALLSSSHLTLTPVTEGLVDEILRVALDAADEVRGLPAPLPPPEFTEVLDALDRGDLSPADLLALPEDDVHAMVAGVLAGPSGESDSDGSAGDASSGMAPLLAAIERLPGNVGARLVRAYLAAVLE
ncbi:pyridoxal phosphate-dependent decarboxylase family protein [Rhodococcus sp. IEGM 1408]|uniref:pyridoxal phosphate-dependent decarboxylase family protein n=1 Tax=Rhodococcus sp. IEGM 1408 TaxID=3082220 RepID=UPI0029550F1D|nr:aminotransferase class V-fold PLP-dependent enzyme [Rhodococcus sp. IEGM 1408]MDV8000254.1 aminotransferase class V-fold PLP-dependent enzyme [Rhodococcus sp. IEGM 1408]